MVSASDSEEERLRKLMAMRGKRSKLLHNITLTCLKVGNQNHLRCMKGNFAGSDVSGDKDSDKKLSASKLGIETNGNHGNEEIGGKLLSDLKTTADNVKNSMLRKEMVVEEENDDAAKMLKAVAAEAPGLAALDAKPYNRRSKRGVSNQNSPSSKENDAKLPRRGRAKQEWPKFYGSLTKKEIEEDFIAMSKRRPPRRPQKRPKTVQKQLDMLLPGLWLSEITANSYK